MLIPNRTPGDVLANLGALALGVASYAIPIALVLFVIGAALGVECPPYNECSGSGRTNHPNCKCWDSK